MFDELIKKIEDIKIVPVVVLNDAENAKPLAKALCEGGLPCAHPLLLLLRQDWFLYAFLLYCV